MATVQNEKPVMPLVHLGGSGRATLEEQNQNALEHLAAAIEAVHKAQPHGRDYYPISDNAYSEARAAHDERIRKLQAVFNEIMAIRDHVQSV